MALYALPALPVKADADAARISLTRLQERDPLLYQELFLDGRSSTVAGAMDCDTSDTYRANVSLTHGVSIAEDEWHDLQLESLRRTGLIDVALIEKGMRRITGRFQIMIIDNPAFGNAGPVYLISDFPWLDPAHAVFPAFVFRCQFEYHLNQLIPRLQPGSTLLDAGCGSGAYALCCAKGLPDIRIVGIDVNPRALHLARLGAMINGVESQVSFLEEDLHSFRPRNRFDIVVSAPPYVPLPPHLCGRFYVWGDGGADGFRHLRALVARKDELVQPDGLLSLVASSLGNELDDRFEWQLGAALGDWKVTSKHPVFPPMWTFLNPSWMDRNPLPVAEYYSRLPASAALDAWVENLQTTERGFLHNLYVEIEPTATVSRQTRPDDLRVALSGTRRRLADCAEAAIEFPTASLSGEPEESASANGPNHEFPLLRLLEGSQYQPRPRLNTLGRLGRELRWGIVLGYSDADKSWEPPRVFALGPRDRRADIRIAGSLLQRWFATALARESVERALEPILEELSLRPRSELLAISFDSSQWGFLRAPDCRAFLSRSGWLDLHAEIADRQMALVSELASWLASAIPAEDPEACGDNTREMATALLAELAARFSPLDIPKNHHFKATLRAAIDRSALALLPWRLPAEVADRLLLRLSGLVERQAPDFEQLARQACELFGDGLSSLLSSSEASEGAAAFSRQIGRVMETPRSFGAEPSLVLTSLAMVQALDPDVDYCYLLTVPSSRGPRVLVLGAPASLAEALAPPALLATNAREAIEFKARRCIQALSAGLTPSPLASQDNDHAIY